MTQNERIRAVRKKVGLTIVEFGDRLGVSNSAISMIETGKNNASNQTITQICQTFGVNEHWLRTGEGEMMAPQDREKEIMAFIGDILKGEPDFRRALVHVLARMTTDQWAMMEAKARELLEEMETPPQDGGGVR